MLEERAREVETFFQSESEESDSETVDKEEKEEGPKVTESLGDIFAEETAVVEETPAVGETPVADKAPAVEETPLIVETPVVEETPVVVETPALEATPVTVEIPVVEETPAVEETPSAAVGEAALSLDWDEEEEPKIKKEKDEENFDVEMKCVISDKDKFENLKRLSIAKLDSCPSLHGSPGQFINLVDATSVKDPGAANTGLNNLMDLFVKQVTSCAKKSPTKKDVHIK